MNTQTSQKTPGRNDPCPCGSGKKYKKCCGSLDSSKQANQRNLLNQASSLFESGRFPETIQVCGEILASSPGNSSAHNLIGLAQYRLGNLYDAKLHLEAALQSGPRNALLLNNLCHITEILGDPETARHFCEQAISLNPKLADAYNNLGNVLLNFPDSQEKAIEQYKKATKLDPKNANFVANIAAALHKNNKFDEAVPYYKKAMELEPAWTEPLKNLGALYFQKRNNVKAIAYYERALAIDGQDTDTLLNLSLVQMGAGDLEGAEWCLRRIDEIRPGLARTQLHFARLYQKFGLLGKMEAACAEAAEREPNNPEVYLEWAEYEESRHKLARAQDLLEKAESTGPLRQNLLRAKIARRNKDWNLALEELEKLDQDKLKDADKYLRFYDKGYLLDKMGEYDDAWKAFFEATRLKAELENIHYDFSEQKKYLEEFKNVYRPESINQASIRTRGKLAINGVQPLFIVGFPRSGTTLLEQILCSHPNISAGDELPYLREIGVKLADEFAMGEELSRFLEESNEQELVARLKELQGNYLEQVKKLGIVDLTGDYFTDKMPLNLNYLPLIHLLFPGSPIIHIVRNPMDTCLSNFFSHFGTGNHHSLDIDNCANYFKLTFDFAEFNRTRLNDLKYMQVRYEDLVYDQENTTRAVIDFVGEPWDEACLNHHLTKRVSRTISYEQVTNKIYTSSVSRYLNYERHLSKPLQVLHPIMLKMGYLENGPGDSGV